MDGEPEDVGEYPMMDFQMPDFSSIGQTMKLLSWLPAILSSVTVFILSFLVQVVYNGLTKYDYDLTYGAFMVMILISLVIAIVVGILVKVASGRKAKSFAF